MNLVLGKPLVHVTGETKSRARYPGCSKLNCWVDERLPILICSGPEWRGGLLVHPHFHREQDLAWQLGGALLLLLLLLLMFSEGVFAQILLAHVVYLLFEKNQFPKSRGNFVVVLLSRRNLCPWIHILYQFCEKTNSLIRWSAQSCAHVGLSSKEHERTGRYNFTFLV